MPCLSVQNGIIFRDQLDMTLYFDRFIFDSLMQFFLIVSKNLKGCPFSWSWSSNQMYPFYYITEGIEVQYS